MTIEISWLNENQTAIVYSFGTTWTWSEFSQQDKLADCMMETATCQVDIIADFTNVSSYPPNALSNFQYYVKQWNPNRGRIILVGAQLLFRTLAENIIKLAPKMSQEMTLVSTFEEARQLVEARDHQVREEPAG